LPSRASFANLNFRVIPPALGQERRTARTPERIAPTITGRVMKVTVERAALLRSLGHVHRVVERRNTIPILSNVLLRAEDGGMRLKATDLDIEVTETIPADVSQPGSTTVPAYVIYDIVRKLPEGAQVSLEMTGDTGQMQLRSGRSRFLLQSLPESDFPDLAAGELPHRFTVPAGDLKRLIDKTQFAISTEETRYYLNGIYLHTLDAGGQTVLRAVATDGHRLARVELPAPAGSEAMPGIIVPRKAVAEIQKLVETMGEGVLIELSSAKVRLSLGGVVLTSKLIDGTFPDYQRVIPAANDKRLTVERDDFAKAVDRVSTISSERGRAVKLAINEGRLLRLGSDRYRLQRPLSPRHHGPARRRHRPVQARRSRFTDGDPGPRGRLGTLRPDADAGVRRWRHGHLSA
jgi:DNA polymerase III subunit beta